VLVDPVVDAAQLALDLTERAGSHAGVGGHGRLAAAGGLEQRHALLVRQPAEHLVVDLHDGSGVADAEALGVLDAHAVLRVMVATDASTYPS
jgi:hypothetical protein